MHHASQIRRDVRALRIQISRSNADTHPKSTLGRYTPEAPNLKVVSVLLRGDSSLLTDAARLAGAFPREMSETVPRRGRVLSVAGCSERSLNLGAERQRVGARRLGHSCTQATIQWWAGMDSLILPPLLLHLRLLSPGLFARHVPSTLVPQLG